MELKEFIEKWKVSERDIIEAAKLTSSICSSFDCENCPFDSNYGCLITLVPADVNIGEEVKKRIQKLLHPNHMEKVAEVLGVRLDWITVTNTLGETSRYCLTKNGLYNDRGIAVPGLLTDLLIGRAYIVKEESKDE